MQLRDDGVAVESRASSRVDAILGAIAASAVELLGSPDRRSSRVPRAALLYFVSARERQQWCTPSCGNRARVARHYARHGL